MRIKMLKTSASPSGTLEAGQIYTLDTKKARALVDSKSAEYVDRPQMEAAVKPPEPEQAVTQEAKEPKSLGGGWFLLADGRKVRKSELNEVE